MLEKLIPEGETLSKNIKDNIISGEAYEIWLFKCIRYIEQYHNDSALTKKFLREYEEGTQEPIYYFNTMRNIIKALLFIEKEEAAQTEQSLRNMNGW